MSEQQQHQQQHRLEVVIKCKAMIKIVYDLIKTIPEEKYCASSQIMRSSLSVPSNIVEGQQRGNKEFCRFLQIAKGSLEELKFQVEIMNEVYLGRFGTLYDDFMIISDEIGRMIHGLSNKVRADADAEAGS